MPSPSLATLLNQQTATQIQATLIQFLQFPGNGLPPLPATSWGATSLGTYFLQSEALVLADLSQGVVNTTMGGFFQLASAAALQYTSGPSAGTSPWVDLGAQQFYNESRLQATSATISAVLSTGVSGAGPYTINPGQITLTDNNGHFYTNLAGGTLCQSNTLSLTFLAQTPGSGSNVSGLTLTMVTALPGVVVQSPAQVTAGTDLESDASLIARCLNKWTSLGTGSPQGAWINWCFAASPEVRYATTLPTGLGGVQVTVWGNNAKVSPGGLQAIDAYLTARMPQCVFLSPPSNPQSPNTSTQNAIPASITATTPPSGSTFTGAVFGAQLYGPASAQTSALSAAAQALTLLVQGTPIGGYPIVQGTPDQYGISNSDFVTAIMNSSPSITKALVSIANYQNGQPVGSTTAPVDMIMPAASGVPVVAQPPATPSAPGSWNLSWNSV